MQAGKKRKRAIEDELTVIKDYAHFPEEKKVKVEYRKVINRSPCISPRQERHQTVVRLLKSSINCPHKITKINAIVDGFSSARIWTLLFLNWYTERTNTVFPFGDTVTPLVFVIKFFVKEEQRGRMFLNSALHDHLVAFSQQFPSSRLADLTQYKVHGNQFNLLAGQMMTNINLYHKQYMSNDYLIQVLSKKKRSTSKKFFRNLVSFEYERVLPPRPFVWRPSNVIDRVRWVQNVLKKLDPEIIGDWYYPKACLGAAFIPFDLFSFQKLFGKDTEWHHHFNCRENVVMTMSTDGFSVHFTIKRRSPQAFEVQQGRVVPIKNCPNEKKSFDDIKKHTNLPPSRGLRFLNALSPPALTALGDTGRVSCDPGKKFVYTAVVEEKTVAMSSGRLKHLMMTPQFIKYDNMRQREIKVELDELSRTRSLLAYLTVLDRHFTRFRFVFGDFGYRRWRFRRFGLRQKVNAVIEKELQTGVKTVDNFYFDDEKRKTQPTGKGGGKRIIYWGDGSVGHCTGNPPVPNRKLVYALCKTNVVVITPEFRTSLCCSACHFKMRRVQTISRRGLRLRQCPNCAVVKDRDVNGCENIDQVAVSYQATGRKPDWQERTPHSDGDII